MIYLYTVEIINFLTFGKNKQKKNFKNDKMTGRFATPRRIFDESANKLKLRLQDPKKQNLF